MLAAIGRRVQRVFQKSSSLLNRNKSTLNNCSKGDNIWKYRITRRSFSTSLFQKYGNDGSMKLRGELKKLIRQYPSEIDRKTANNGIDQFLKSAKNHEEEAECYAAKALVCFQSKDPQGALEVLNKSVAVAPVANCLALRAFALSYLGRAEEALNDFKAAREGFSVLVMSNLWNLFAKWANRTKEYQPGALSVLKQAIQIFPNDQTVAQAFDTVARAVSMDKQERLECYLKAADVNPNNVLAWRYAISLDLDNANQYVTQALLHNPSSHEVIWGTLAATYTQHKDWARAVEAARELLRTEPIQFKSNILALVCQLVDTVLVARQLALLDDCQELLERAIVIDPSNTMAISLLGHTYYFKQQNEWAKEYFLRALKLNKDEAAAIAGLGCIATDIHEQIEHFERAIKLNPGLHQVHKELAQCYYRLEQYERALEAIDRAIDGNPSVTPEHYAIKGLAHGHMQQYDKELQAYLHHFKTQNDPVQAGNIYLIEHRFEEGLTYNDTHLQRDPNNEGLWMQRAVLLRPLVRSDIKYKRNSKIIRSSGLICHHQGRYNEALEVIEKVLELITDGHEHYSLALHQKGLILAHLKRTNEARQIARIISDKYKLTLHGLVLLGEAHFQEGNFEGAVKCFEKLLEDNSDFQPYRYEKYLLLARALEGRGDVTRALEMFALVHHINPFEPISAERLKQLAGK